MPHSTAPKTAIDYARQSQLWQSIQLIPEEVLLGYLADNVIDDAEIEDISQRLASHMRGLSISAHDHALISHMVRQSVEQLRLQQAAKSDEGCISQQLAPATLRDIRSIMGQLVQQGHIKLNVQDAEISPALRPTESIPSDRPEDYDESAPNLLKP